MQTLIQASPERIDKVRRARARKAELETRKLARVDVFAKLGYEPNCKVRHAARQAGVDEDALPDPCGLCPQELFHAATEFDVLFGGAAGGGKSRALTAEAIRACVKYPGIRVGAFRRTYPELEESLLAELAQMSFATALGGVWNGTRHELRFPNGSLIMFRYAETLQDATRRQGGQYQLLVFDERTLTPPNVISFLESRLRSGRKDIPVLGIRSSSNPGGAGHGAVKKRYIAATKYGKTVVTDERGRTVRFIPSRLSDNPHVNPEYARDLAALDETMRAAFLDGNWDMFAGQMFPALQHARHVVEPFTLPSSWKRFQGVDWGYSKPWGVLWAAVDEDGRVWVYREIYKTQVGESEQAKMILAAEAEGEHVAVRYADDAMWAVRGEAKPIADVYAENGVHLTPANKGGRVNGWQRVRSYVGDGPACPHHRALGWVTCPMLHIFSTCPEFYRTLSDLPHATKGDPEDADSTGEDHLPDAARYFLINLGGGPQFIILDDVTETLLEANGIEVLTDAGTYAVRENTLDMLFGKPEEHAGTTQKSPFA
ncbi:MAG TPA: terminase family protein [Streptosporangiaceae bacterium]|nr:terminase family protein [Streptosporangiaceae bacterium]